MKQTIILFILVSLFCSCRKYYIKCATDAECEQMIVGRWGLLHVPGSGVGGISPLVFCENGRFYKPGGDEDNLSFSEICELNQPDTLYYSINNLVLHITGTHLLSGDHSILKLTDGRLKLKIDGEEETYGKKTE